MQRLFAQQPPAPGSFEVRPAAAADRPALTRLTEHARRSHFHLDWWSLADWLIEPSSNAWVAAAGKHIAGVVIAPPQDGPVAWVRLAAVADGYSAEAVLRALLPATTEVLAASGASSLASLAYPEWLSDELSKLGFAAYTDVAHFRKDDRAIPDIDSRGVAVRPAASGDLATVLANDRAAFDPIWWHTLDSLARVQREAAQFIVAEVDERIVGHAFSDLYGGRGHLVRLATHPDFQGLGVGARLLAEALTFLLAVGAYPITLNTQTDNYTSQSLYRRFGFAPSGDATTVMLRPLG